MDKLKKYFPLLFSLLFILLLIIIVLLIKQAGYWLSYQVSVSMPKGWYLIKPVKTLKHGMIVVFRPPEATQLFLQKHHWLPNNGIMMKHVVAVPGEKICKKDHFIWINKRKFARYYKYYAHNKLLPNKRFCGVLNKQEYLLMSKRVWNSFDGRYFGPVKRQAVIGQAVKL